jgi:citrate lyase beta subunit
MRLRRSILTVPGNNLRFIEKSIQLPCDGLVLDLEDGVPLDEKAEARTRIAGSLTDMEWGKKVVSVRINGLDTPFAYRDIIEVVEKGGERLDCLIVPKVNRSADIHFVSILLDQLESDLNRSNRIGIEASIETASGLNYSDRIARASDRMEALVFGVADYTISIGAKGGGLSGHGEDQGLYPGHRWHFPLSRMAMAAKAAGIMAIDAPFGNLRDLEGLKESVRMAAAIGCDGKWVIHPSQIEPCNAIFSPTPEEVEMAVRVLKACEGGRKGPIALDGRMIDTATQNLARQTYERARRIGMVKD